MITVVAGDVPHAAGAGTEGVGVAVGTAAAQLAPEAVARLAQRPDPVAAFDRDRAESPAQTLTRVDRALATLGVGALATALVARLERPVEQAAAGPRRLRWSSAGHLPPLLARPDGKVHVLASPPERLLGTDAPGPRTDHEVALRPGDTVLLYTDGLVEHGHRDLDDGIAELTAVLGGLATLPLDELCDQVLDRLVTGRTDDDIALLAVHDARAGSARSRPTGS